MRFIVISTSIGFLGSGRGGGVELTLNSLVNGLLNKGHSVSVVAPFNSRLSKSCTKAELFCVDGEEPKSWQHKDYYSPIPKIVNSITNAMLEKAMRLADNADLIINLSFDWLPISITNKTKIPIAHLISMGDESFEIRELISKMYNTHPNHFAFHSKSQAADYSFITNPIIVGNGFNLDNYKFHDSMNGALAWVGRVAPEKGLEDAVFVANELKEKINVWGIVQDEEYAKNIEKSFPSANISWKGFKETNQLQEQLRLSRALINTPKWNEAYGNVVVEAMACGVPVVAYKRGGPSEIIQHGKNGFLVTPDDKQEIISFLKRINEINRKDCRKWVENNASSEIFSEKIIKWIKKII